MLSSFASPCPGCDPYLGCSFTVFKKGSVEGGQHERGKNQATRREKNVD